MTYTMIRLTVADYAKWRVGFDAAASARKALGATGNDQIYRESENPNAVVAVLEWKDEKKAREWFQSPTLKQAQQSAGVTATLGMQYLSRS